jgi:hypothetical protein
MSVKLKINLTPQAAYELLKAHEADPDLSIDQVCSSIFESYSTLVGIMKEQQEKLVAFEALYGVSDDEFLDLFG